MAEREPARKAFEEERDAKLKELAQRDESMGSAVKKLEFEMQQQIIERDHENKWTNLLHSHRAALQEVDRKRDEQMMELCELNMYLIDAFSAYQKARAKELEAEGNKAAAAHAQ